MQLPFANLSKAQEHNAKKLAEAGQYSALHRYLQSFSAKDSSFRTSALPRRPFILNEQREKNHFANLVESQLNTRRTHTPLAPPSRKSDYIGVEIECYIPRTNTVRDVESLAESLKGLVRRVAVKHDGSLSERVPEGHFGAELVVLTRLSRPSELHDLCERLFHLGAKVTKRCGLHIHLDARHLSSDEVKAAGKRFDRALPLMLSMVPPSRRQNSYCKPSVSSLTDSRYHAVNLTSYYRYKTIEVRLHSGTTDFSKIMHWAHLCSAIFKAEKISKTCKTINELTDYIRIPEWTMEYVQQRIDLFAVPRTEASQIEIQFTDFDEVTEQAV